MRLKNSASLASIACVSERCLALHSAVPSVGPTMAPAPEAHKTDVPREETPILTKTADGTEPVEEEWVDTLPDGERLHASGFLVHVP